jgi:DNA-binding transcriptional MerR regulator
MALKKINKLYYSIGEVSKITNLKQYVLRYWETEFSVLNPSKNSAGNRIYKDKDIVLIKYIQDLLYTEKFTIKGAKLHIKKEFSSQEDLNVKTIKLNPILSKEDLLNIRKSLNDILTLIDSYKD